MMGDKFGTRPSQFFEWTEPDEWYERLNFDMRCFSTYQQQKSKAMSKAMKKPRRR